MKRKRIESIQSLLQRGEKWMFFEIKLEKSFRRESHRSPGWRGVMPRKRGPPSTVGKRIPGMSGHRISRFVNRAFGPEIILRSSSFQVNAWNAKPPPSPTNVNDHRPSLDPANFLPLSFLRPRERSVYTRVTRRGEKEENQTRDRFLLESVMGLDSGWNIISFQITRGCINKRCANSEWKEVV